MEKSKDRRRNQTGHQLCFPILRASTGTHPAVDANHHHHRTARTSLLERIREAIFRLIMASAISKSAPGLADPAPAKTPVVLHPREFHQCDAVAECIEFIKKSAASKEHELPLSPSNVSTADHSGGEV